MELSVYERIFLLYTLPKKGSLEDMVIYRDIEEKIRMSQEEVTDLKIVTNPESGHVSWDQEKAQDKKTDLTDAEQDFIRKGLGKIAEDGEFPLQALCLYDKGLVGEKKGK
jgi:hypothetical protein